MGMARTRAKTEADAAKAKDEERERKLKEQLYARERGKFKILPGTGPSRLPGHEPVRENRVSFSFFVDFVTF